MAQLKKLFKLATAMKRYLLLLTGALAIANIAGIMPFYSLGLMEVKTEIQKELGNEGALQKLVIADVELSDKSVFSWVEAGEFSYMGRMYDMAHCQKMAGYTVFFVIQDEKEDNLLALLKVFYQDNHQNGESNSPLSHLLKNITKDFIPCSVTAELQAPLSTNSGLSTRVPGSICAGFSSAPIIPPGA